MKTLNPVLTFLISAMFWFLGLLPRFIVDFLAKTFARLWYISDSKHRKIAIQNLTLAFGDVKTPKEIQILAKKSFYNISLIPFEIGWNYRLGLSDLKEHFEIRGLHHIQDALAKGKGVLCLTAHIGNWELIPVVAAIANFTACILYRPLDFLPLDVFFIRLRSRFGAQLIPKTGSMTKIFKQLKTGNVIAFLMDQNVDWYEGVFVDFFNHRACTSKGLSLIALKTKAPVVPVFMVRENNDYIIEFGQELKLIQTGDLTNDIEANTMRYNQTIEEIIRRYPDQWFWVHNRWKTKPFCTWPRNGTST